MDARPSNVLPTAPIFERGSQVRTPRDGRLRKPCRLDRAACCCLGPFRGISAGGLGREGVRAVHSETKEIAGQQEINGLPTPVGPKRRRDPRLESAEDLANVGGSLLHRRTERFSVRKPSSTGGDWIWHKQP